MNSVLDTFRKMAGDYSLRWTRPPSPLELCSQLFSLPHDAYPMN